jgi:hypothetical protein
MKLKIQSPIIYEKTPSEFERVNCFHCGKEFEIHINNLRSANYCSGCK